MPKKRRKSKFKDGADAATRNNKAVNAPPATSDQAAAEAYHQTYTLRLHKGKDTPIVFDGTKIAFEGDAVVTHGTGHGYTIERVRIEMNAGPKCQSCLRAFEKGMIIRVDAIETSDSVYSATVYSEGREHENTFIGATECKIEPAVQKDRGVVAAAADFAVHTIRRVGRILRLG